MTSVFVSHSVRHAESVRRLTEMISPFGYSVVSSLSMAAGADLKESVLSAIQAADIVMIVFDPLSTNTANEVGYLMALKKPSLVIADMVTPLPSILSDVACIRLEGVDEWSGYRVVAALDALKDRVNARAQRRGDEAFYSTVLAEMNSVDFERTVTNWFRSLELRVEHVAPKDRDFDLIVKDRAGHQYVVEFKKYGRGRLISLEDVRGLLHAVTRTDSHSGILITTSDFTRSAKDFARHVGAPLYLWRTDEFDKWTLPGAPLG